MRLYYRIIVLRTMIMIINSAGTLRIIGRKGIGWGSRVIPMIIVDPCVPMLFNDADAGFVP